MKIIMIAIFAMALLLTGCSQNTTEDPEGGAFIEQLSNPSNDSSSKNLDGEIIFYPTYSTDYKTGNNEMFDFWFDIPVDWNAIDESEDGSEYYIICDNEKAIIRIFGILMDEAGDDYCNKLAGKSGTISEFIFCDGWIGNVIDVTPNVRYFVRVDGDSYMVLQVDLSADPAWLLRNEEKVNYIASSARTTRQSIGKNADDGSSITPDDLWLGDIDIDMTYEELLAVVGQEPLDVIEEQYEGMNTKTLFFPDDTQVYVVNDVVYTVNVTSSDYETPRGLKPGDREDRVTELYGEPNKKDEGVWGYNINGYELFTVVVDEGLVTQIQIEQGVWATEVY